MQGQKKRKAATAKPTSVEVKTVSAKGKINVGPTTSPAKKADVTKIDKTKVTDKKAALKSEPKATKVSKPDAPKAAVAATTAKPSPLKTRALAAAGLCVVIAGLGISLMGSSESEAETPVVAAAPVQPEITDVVQATAQPENTATTEVASSDNAELVGNIIGALRQSQPSAPQATAAVAPKENAMSSIYQLVTTAVAEGQSKAYIHQLLNDAMSKGDITMPQTLLREDGDVDIDSIMVLFAGN